MSLAWSRAARSPYDGFSTKDRRLRSGGARRPEQLDPLEEIEGWHVDEASRSEIDAILAQTITDPVSPAFMAPPAKRPVGVP